MNFALDNNNDLYSNGSIISGVLEVAQNIKNKILFIPQDYFLDVESGVDLLSTEQNKMTIERLQSQIKREAQTAFGVVNITSVEVSLDDNRKANAVIRFESIYGNGELIENI